MLKKFFKNSCFSRILMMFEGISKKINLWLVSAYNNSHMNNIMRAFWEGAKVNFKNSFIVRISEIDLEGSTIILKNSKLVKWLLALFAIYRSSIINCMKTSVIATSAITIRKELNAAPIKTGVIIIIATLLANMFFSILLSKRIMLSELTLQSLILFICLVAIFCRPKWEDIKKTSFVIRYIKYINRC